jgi:Gpi18-like mannosyltransferase
MPLTQGAAMPRWIQVAVLVFLGVCIRLIFVPYPGHVVDMNASAGWSLKAAGAPWNMVYEATDANYPPASMIFFEAVGRIYAAWAPAGDGDYHLLKDLVKLPNILFDALGIVVVYALARRFAPHLPALGAAALFAFNPAIIYDSALWGQNDTITTVSALAALMFTVWDRRALAWICIAFAVLAKPPVVVLVPLLAIEPFTTGDPAERVRRLRGAGIGIVIAAVLGYALTASFYTQTEPLAVIGRLIDWYRIGSALYPYTSANAFNLWAFLPQFFLSDTTRVLFVTLKGLGNAAFVILAGALYWHYFRTRTRESLIETAYLLMLGFFLVLTEMHERYLIYALTIVPALAVVNRRYLWSTVALSLTEWLNLEYSLNYMWIKNDNPPGIDPYAFSPVLARLCAITNIAAFGVGVVTAREAGSDEPADAGKPAASWRSKSHA